MPASRIWIAGCLFAAFCLNAFAYSPSFDGGFVFDDKHAIVNNDSLRTLWPLSTSCWAMNELPTAGRPVANFSLAVNYAIGKLDSRGYHFFSLVVHTINMCLVFAVVHPTLASLDLTGVSSRQQAEIALTVAVVWSVHPLLTEAVSYMTQRTELLAALFMLATLWTTIKAWNSEVTRHRDLWCIIAVLCCGLGMASKEIGAVMPVLVLLYDFAFLKTPWKQVLNRRKYLYLGLAATWGIIVAIFVASPRGETVGITSMALSWAYLKMQSWGICHYLQQSFIPFGLCADFGVFHVDPSRNWFPCFLFLTGIAIASAAAWFYMRSLAYLGTWFFFILGPTSSFIPITTEPMAERRMYLPLLSIVILVAIAALHLRPSWPVRFGSPISKNQFTFFRIGALTVISFFVGCTYWRNTVYQSELTFWTDVVAKQPKNARGLANLGMTWTSYGNHEEGFRCLSRARDLEPDYSEFHFYLGVWYMAQEQPDNALVSFERTLALNSEDVRAEFNRGVVLNQLGRSEEAILSFRRVIESVPEFFSAYLNLGSLLISLGRHDEGIETLQACIALRPNESVGWTELGKAFHASGNLEEAEKCDARAKELASQQL